MAFGPDNVVEGSLAMTPPNLEVLEVLGTGGSTGCGGGEFLLDCEGCGGEYIGFVVAVADCGVEA
jgi:hypothetical protein